MNKSYWKDLLTRLQKRNFHWFAESDLSVSEDDELLELMRQSGCAQVLIGLESPQRESLQGIELRNNYKYREFDEYKHAIRNIQSHGITVNGCFVLGLDGQTPEVFEEVFEFVKETELYEVQITLMTPFPGTALYDRLAKANRLIEPTNWKEMFLIPISTLNRRRCPWQNSIRDSRNWRCSCMKQTSRNGAGTTLRNT